MKIRLSELRQIVREEIARVVSEGSPEEDQAQYEKIMAMITGALGDSPETQKFGTELQGAFKSKVSPSTPDTITMNSVAQQPSPTATTPSKPATPTGPTIRMRSVR
jgi:hypothetical protein